jgi:CDP-diacylglycerol--serine O-phosphatidyltransferase
MIKRVSKPWYSFVPSLFTSMNLTCGIIAAYLSLEGKIEIALLLMVIAAFFDFIDGFVARLLKVAGDFGKELDSLADVVSFGIVPGAMLFFVQKTHFPQFANGSALTFLQWILLLSPILIPVFSALRLAKFNIDERQKSEFIGLPTPATALFFASLCYTFISKPENILTHLNQPIIVAITIVVFSYLLISEIPLFALKFSSFGWKKNVLRYTFILCSIALIAVLGITGLTGVILLYILFSTAKNTMDKLNRKHL